MEPRVWLGSMATFFQYEEVNSSSIHQQMCCEVEVKMGCVDTLCIHAPGSKELTLTHCYIRSVSALASLTSLPGSFFFSGGKEAPKKG